jgi:hypothetical protein
MSQTENGKGKARQVVVTNANAEIHRALSPTACNGCKSGGDSFIVQHQCWNNYSVSRELHLNIRDEVARATAWHRVHESDITGCYWSKAIAVLEEPNCAINTPTEIIKLLLVSEYGRPCC